MFLLLLLPALVWAQPVERGNPMENEGLFEGDIMGIDPDGDRNAILKDYQRWPGGVIPYVVETSSSGQINLLTKAMRHIEEKTCLRFVPRTTEKNYISIFKGTGCWSFWGCLNRGMQQVSIGDGCEYHGIVVHELMHAIGFQHEHNRPDRDDYLIIHWGNIDSKFHSSFAKLGVQQTRMLTSFDYDSIMMYGERSFSKEPGRLKSMSSKDDRFLDEAYNKNGLSKDDIRRIEILYGCPS